MSTGTPAIVSNYGGPRDIVGDESCGRILPLDEAKWLATLEECRKLKLEQEDDYLKMREASHRKSQKYTLENASKAQFQYFREVYEAAYGKQV